MYAITGATGHLGRKVIASLKDRVPASTIVAVARNAAKSTDLGVALREADYADAPSLESALRGIDKLLMISSSAPFTRQEEHANVVHAAKKAGVRHIFYTSLLGAERWTVAFKDDHLYTEKLIIASGMRYTILRNGWYWENHTASIAATLAQGALVGSAGEAKISYASRQDFADAAVATMTQDGHQGKLYELAGDNAYTLAELAAEVARQTGRRFAYHNLTLAEHAACLEKAGLPPGLSTLVAGVEANGVSTGVLHDDSRLLSGLIGRPTTSIHEAVATALRS